MALLYAIILKCAWSLVVFREVPSAIFEAIETAARCICDINPNLSAGGNFSVILYTHPASKRACCQHSNFSNEYIFIGKFKHIRFDKMFKFKTFVFAQIFWQVNFL